MPAKVPPGRASGSIVPPKKKGSVRKAPRTAKKPSGGPKAEEVDPAVAEQQRLSEEASRAYAERVKAEDDAKLAQARAKEEFWAEQDAAPYWEVPLGKDPNLPWLGTSTGLLVALERCASVAGKVPLVIDNTSAKAVDTFYMYRSVPILEAKKMFMDERTGASRESVLDEARQKLVQAMKGGCTLYIRLANSACDFLHKYTNPASFPIDVFDQTHVQTIRETHTLGRGDGDCVSLAGSEHPFAAALRPEDLDAGSLFFARDGFDVVVCTHFETADIDDFLKGSIPLDKLQPIKIYQS